MRRHLLPIMLLSTLLAPVGGSASERKAPATVASPSPYTITDLGTLGGPDTRAYGVNDAGKVVGGSQSGSYMVAFSWDGGTMTNLGDLTGRGSFAHDVNEAGQVVGGSALADWSNHAVRWQNGSMQDLGTLGGPVSFAFDINNSGQAVGYAWNDEAIQHAVLWGSGGIVDLGDLDPMWPNHSAAYGINDAGQVVGGSYTDIPGQFHAFRWQGGGMQDLGTLGGEVSSAEAINEVGHVVGSSRLAGNTTTRAFLWDGGMQDLGALGWTHSIAYDINDGGQVVGALQTGALSHAFVWADGQIQDLNNLIPASSGWVLSEARAINNRGRIAGFGQFAGQTRAFLLVPREYRWINPAGGAWSLSTNWDPQGVPGPGDTAVFALAGQYSVDTTTLDSPASSEADEMRVEGSNTVDFHGLNLSVFTDLRVGEGGIVNIHSGAGSFDHGIVGALPPQTTNPPTARLQVFNSGTTLTSPGRLTIGHEGAGDLFVANGGHLTCAETRLGGPAATGTGSAVVGGDGSLWQTGNIAVGHGFSGDLTIENGGRVDSNDAFVSVGFFSDESKVLVEGVGAGTGQASMWALLGSLTVGQTEFGSVEALNGGDLYVSQDVHIKNGELNIEGRHANGDPSDLDVLGTVFVGGSGSANFLAFRNAAKGDIEGDLIIGKDGAGAAVLWGQAIISNPTQLDVVDPLAGLCAIGREFEGAVSVDGGGLLRCRSIELGGRAGTNGRGTLIVDGGMVRALDVLTVGQVGGGSGQVDMTNNALVATTGTYIAPNGAIDGAGTLSVGFLGLQNDGTLAPGITVWGPLPGAAASRSGARAQVGTATLTIDGALTIGSAGRLKIPLTGSLPGQYGSLAVTGSANLAGVLVLDFHYAPRTGDLLTLLAVAQGAVGAFGSVEITGLQPGFEYEITYANGQVVIEALNDGVPGDLIFADGFQIETVP